MIRIKVLFILLLFFVITASSYAKDIVYTKQLLKIPEDMQHNLLGLRVRGSKVYIGSSSGKILCFDLQGNRVTRLQAGGGPILDFEIVDGAPAFLDTNGQLGGKVKDIWKNTSFAACRIDSSDMGLMLSGGDEAYFLDDAATMPVTIPQISLVLPVANGFFWTVQIKSNGNWGADLYECLGNKVSDTYSFNNSTINAIEMGPAGIEGELLLIIQENNNRFVNCIGHNGRMFWKVKIPDRVCLRDLALTDKENLLLLLQKNGQIWLTRLILDAAEG